MKRDLGSFAYTSNGLPSGLGRLVGIKNLCIWGDYYALGMSVVNNGVMSSIMYFTCYRFSTDCSILIQMQSSLHHLI